MASKITIGILLLVAVFGVVYLFSSFLENPINTASVIDNPEESSQATGNTHVIEMTSSGFAPSMLTVSKGDTVNWINRDTEKHWPASAVHPTHTVYPGSDIKKCFEAGTDKTSIFDACRGLDPGESYSFTFNEIGTWGYHDHLNAKLFGKVTVK